MTPEGKVKAILKSELKKLGVWQFWPTTHGFGFSGLPDCIFLYRGTMVGCELKAPGRRNQEFRGCTALQKRALSDIEQHGGLAFVVDCQDEINAMLEVVAGMK